MGLDGLEDLVGALSFFLILEGGVIMSTRVEGMIDALNNDTVVEGSPEGNDITDFFPGLKLFVRLILSRLPM